MSARQTWDVADTEFPANGSSRQRLGFAIKQAALAASPDDWQAWDVVVEDNHLNLFVRPAPDLDPDETGHRAGLIQCGVLLQYLKVTLKRFGCLGRVELFPDLDRRSLVSRLHVGFGGERDSHEKALFEAMTVRREQGSTWLKKPVELTTLGALSQVVATERGWIEFTHSATSRRRVLEFTLANEPSRSISNPVSTALGVVKTKTDDEHGWLNAGQTLALAKLHSQSWGLSWECLDQLPRRESRCALRTGVGHKGFGQAILQYGPMVPCESVRLTPAATSTATSVLG